MGFFAGKGGYTSPRTAMRRRLGGAAALCPRFPVDVGETPTPTGA